MGPIQLSLFSIIIGAIADCCWKTIKIRTVKPAVCLFIIFEDKNDTRIKDLELKNTRFNFEGQITQLSWPKLAFIHLI